VVCSICPKCDSCCYDFNVGAGGIGKAAFPHYPSLLHIPMSGCQVPMPGCANYSRLLRVSLRALCKRFGESIATGRHSVPGWVPGLIYLCCFPLPSLLFFLCNFEIHSTLCLQYSTTFPLLALCYKRAGIQRPQYLRFSQQTPSTASDFRIADFPFLLHHRCYRHIVATGSLVLRIIVNQLYATLRVIISDMISYSYFHSSFAPFLSSLLTLRPMHLPMTHLSTIKCLAYIL
jgi:hypothetical protein